MSRTVKVEKVEEADAGLDAEFEAALELDPEPDPELEPEADVLEERPSWLPAIFLTPEDLAKSWSESQAALTRTNQKLSELSEENAVLREERLSVAERVGNLERAYLAAVGAAR